MNIITERHEIGITMNLGKYPVIGLDMDNKPYKEYDNFIIGSKVRVAWDRKDPKWEGMTSRCELMVDEGKYHLNSHGCCLLKIKWSEIPPDDEGFSEDRHSVYDSGNPGRS